MQKLKYTSPYIHTYIQPKTRIKKFTLFCFDFLMYRSNVHGSLSNLAIYLYTSVHTLAKSVSNVKFVLTSLPHPAI